MSKRKFKLERIKDGPSLELGIFSDDGSTLVGLADIPSVRRTVAECDKEGWPGEDTTYGMRIRRDGDGDVISSKERPRLNGEELSRMVNEKFGLDAATLKRAVQATEN